MHNLEKGWRSARVGNVPLSGSNKSQIRIMSRAGTSWVQKSAPACNSMNRGVLNDGNQKVSNHNRQVESYADSCYHGWCLSDWWTAIQARPPPPSHPLSSYTKRPREPFIPWTAHPLSASGRLWRWHEMNLYLLYFNYDIYDEEGACKHGKLESANSENFARMKLQHWKCSGAAAVNSSNFSNNELVSSFPRSKGMDSSREKFPPQTTSNDVITSNRGVHNKDRWVFF